MYSSKIATLGHFQALQIMFPLKKMYINILRQETKVPFHMITKLKSSDFNLQTQLRDSVREQQSKSKQILL